LFKVVLVSSAAKQHNAAFYEFVIFGDRKMSVKNILVADDEQQIRSLLTAFIENEGYMVFSAANGKEAIEIVKNNSIDLAILDVVMPEMDGITALKLIKKIDRSIEILVVTGCGDFQSLREVIEQEGVFDYFVKPFVIEDIKHSIERALQRRELNLKKNFVSADMEHRIREMESDFTHIQEVNIRLLSAFGQF